MFIAMDFLQSVSGHEEPEKNFFRILAPPDQVSPLQVDKVEDCLFQRARDTPEEFDIIFKSPAFENVLNDLTLSVSTHSEMNIALKHCLTSGQRWGYGIENISSKDIPGNYCPIAPYCGVLSLCTESEYKSKKGSGSSLWDTHDLAKPEDVHKDMFFTWNKVIFSNEVWRKDRQARKGVIRGWDHPFILIHRKEDDKKEVFTPIVDQRSLGIFINHRCVNYNTEFYDVNLKIFLMDDNTVCIYKLIDDDPHKEGWAVIYGPDGSRNDDDGTQSIPIGRIKAFYTLALPSIFSIKKIKPREELTLNYGPSFIALSPELFSTRFPKNQSKIPKESEATPFEIAIEQLKRQRDAILKYNADNQRRSTFCLCEDCIQLEENDRSVFCPE